MTIWPGILALLIILLFVALLYIAIRTSRIQAAFKTSQAESLGFEPVSSLPSELLRRVEELYRRKSDHSIYIDQVFSKDKWDQQEYIFNVDDANEDDSDIGSEVFGLISSQLDLPHFRLVTLPGVFGQSGFGGLMEKVLEKVLTFAEKYQGLERIEFPNRPDFDQAVVVFGKDADSVRELLRGFQPSSYTQSQMPLFIGGVDDFLAVDFSQKSGSGANEEDLITLHNQFTQITRYFLR